MDEPVVVALIGVGGVVVGSVLSFLCQLCLNKTDRRKENRRAVYQLLVETYADAIRYIALCCRTSIENKTQVEISEASIQEDELYRKFHPLFTILVSREKIEQYNELRNDAISGRVTPADAYLKVVKILDFNICDEI